MPLLDRLLRALGYQRVQPPPKSTIEFDSETSSVLRSLADREGLSEEALASNLMSYALEQRGLTDELLLRWATLSRREQQVVAYIVTGEYTNRQIAAFLNVSHSTINAHVKNILRKFHMHSKAELGTALHDWDLSPWRK
jgi:DNA-binding CsgD family transcriptional regulator